MPQSRTLSLLWPWLCLLCFSGPLQAQQPKAKPTFPVGRFLEDSIQIGQPLHYVLTYEHPADQEVVFPDSAYAYPGFEYIGRQYYPTVTQEGLSRDSVVYELMTFDMAPSQSLALPVYLLGQHGKDSLLADPASVALATTLAPADTATTVIENAAPLPVERQLNYPYLLAGLGALLLLAVVVALAFGKPLRRRWKLRKLQQAHERFVSQFASLSDPEQLLSIWKGYVGGLLQQPLQSFTTPEIRQRLQDDALGTALGGLDAAIYGGRALEHLAEDRQYMGQYAQQVFEKKKQEMTHG